MAVIIYLYGLILIYIVNAVNIAVYPDITLLAGSPDERENQEMRRPAIKMIKKRATSAFLIMINSGGKVDL